MVRHILIAKQNYDVNESFFYFGTQLRESD